MSGHGTSKAPTLEELTACIRSAVPSLRFTNFSLIDRGDDNLVVVLDGEWIARFPRNAEYRDGFAAELRLLEALRPLSSLCVPHYEYIAPDRSFGVYRRIGGGEMTPARFNAMSMPHRHDILASMSKFLGVLHALPAETIARQGGIIAQTWSGEQFAGLYRGIRRAKIATAVPVRTLARFDAFHDALGLVVPGQSRLAHNDISDDHILSDGTGITGIIDFTDAAFGDPAIDFAWFWRLGEASVDMMLRDYRYASQDLSLKTRSHWIFVRYLINQLWYGQLGKWSLSAEETLAELEPHLKRLRL